MNKIVMNRKKLTVIVLAAATAVFLFSGFLVPVGIVAEPTATLYEYEALKENDFKGGVPPLSAFVSSTGRWHDCGFRGAHPLSCVSTDSLFFFRTCLERTREHTRGHGAVK